MNDLVLAVKLRRALTSVMDSDTRFENAEEWLFALVGLGDALPRPDESGPVMKG